MTLSIKYALCIFLSIACLAADDSVEPALKYTLEINGETHELVLGRPLQLEGAFENPTILLKASPTRLFAYGGVQFAYPAFYGWEADVEEAGLKTWTLSGNDFKIMYFVSTVSLTKESYADAMVEQFGKDKVQVLEKTRNFGSRELTGKFLFIDLAGAILTMEVYQLPSPSGSRLLVFQDSPPEDRACSTEKEKAMELLAGTFRDKMAEEISGEEGED